MIGYHYYNTMCMYEVTYAVMINDFKFDFRP